MLLRGSHISIQLVAVFFLGIGLSGCTRKRSEAIVIGKEHIDIAEIKPSPTPAASGEAKVEPAPAAENDEAASREMGPDEIEVNGTVMKKEVRGTSKDPRATT